MTLLKQTEHNLDYFQITGLLGVLVDQRRSFLNSAFIVKYLQEGVGIF